MNFKTKLIVLVGLYGLFTLKSYAQHEEEWVVEAVRIENYTGAPVANGVIGILPWSEPFSVRHVVLNHIFDIDPQQGVMRVLRGINPFILTMEVDGERIRPENIKNWRQILNMKEATHTTFFTFKNKAEVSYSICALRNMPHVGLINISVKALDDISLDFANTMSVPEEYRNSQQWLKEQNVGSDRIRILRANAESSTGLHKVAASSVLIFDNEAFSREYDENKITKLKGDLKKGESFEFSLAASICSTRDFADPFSESERQVIYAQYQGVELLMNGHRKLWDELWESDIIIEGDKQAQQMVRMSLFYLYSFCSESTGLSISPMGLSSQGYNGHIFWDAELWMFPPMLIMNQGIAESMITYRTDRLAAAEKKAAAYGYKGAMFPWESDDWGEESTPIRALTGQFEHHIVADIAIAAWNYFCVTGDKAWLKDKGYPMMKKCAEFWASRVTYNSDGTYSISKVVGADEYARDVTDNAFTNAAAIKALDYTVAAAKVLGEKVHAEWNQISRNIVIHKSAEGVTMEYEGYNGQQIKQADVNLLAYPLGFITNRDQIRKDLEYYEQKVDMVNGPAMTFSIFCVQYARLGEADKAYEMFLRCFEPNMRPPFGVLAETPTSQNPYFATAAGGVLQAVINGFGGLEITPKGIKQVKAVLPPSWKKLTIKGVGKYRKTYFNSQNR